MHVKSSTPVLAPAPHAASAAEATEETQSVAHGGSEEAIVCQVVVVIFPPSLSFFFFFFGSVRFDLIWFDLVLVGVRGIRGVFVGPDSEMPCRSLEGRKMGDSEMPFTYRGAVAGEVRLERGGAGAP